MKLTRPLGHEVVVERLWRAAAAGRLPHALCFEGPAGTGKFVAMRWFAAGLLCAGGPAAPCLACGPCKRLASGGAGGGHPDLLVVDAVEEGEEQIRIARIADRGGEGGASVESFLSLRSVEGGARAILLREAHRMNAAAQNALLKTLEEPREGTLLLLETHRPDALLPTLRSRCVRLRTERLGEADARAVLEAQGLEPERARALAELSPGSPGEALEAERSGAARILELAQGVLGGALPPLQGAALVAEIEASFPGSTPSAKARARAGYALERLAALVSDWLGASHGAGVRRAAHRGLLEPYVGPGAHGPGPSRLRDAALALAECRADVARNLSPEAVLERAFFVLAGLSGGRDAEALASGRGGGR